MDAHWRDALFTIRAGILGAAHAAHGVTRQRHNIIQMAFDMGTPFRCVFFEDDRPDLECLLFSWVRCLEIIFRQIPAQRQFEPFALIGLDHEHDPENQGRDENQAVQEDQDRDQDI